METIKIKLWFKIIILNINFWKIFQKSRRNDSYIFRWINRYINENVQWKKISVNEVASNSVQRINRCWEFN